MQRGEDGEVLDLLDGLGVDESGLGEHGSALDHAVADGNDAGVLEVGAEFLEEAEDALEAGLVIRNRLLELMLLAVVLVHVVAVARFADLLDEAGDDALLGIKVYELVLDRAGARVDDKSGFRHCWIPPSDYWEMVLSTC